MTKEMRDIKDAPNRLGQPRQVTGLELRELLHRHKLTQRKAAKWLRTTPNTVSRWVCGKAEMPWSAYVALHWLVFFECAEDE